MMRKLYVLAGFILFYQVKLFAQDHLYSQFYNSPIYLNPALTGQFDGSFRMNLIYRSQWTNIPAPLNYYTFSADLNIPNYSSGVGLIATKSAEGLAYLNKVNIAGLYSYKVEFENGILYFGLQAGVTNRSVDYSKLVFFDQLNAQGIIPDGPTSASYPQFNNKFFFDSGAGINLVVGDFMIGTSGQHLNQPNETLTGTTAILPIRWNSYASWKFSTNSNFGDSPSVIPSVVYVTQAGVSSFSAGLQYKNRNVNIGLWYRGDGQQNDAVVLSLIFDLFSKSNNDKYRVGISHDVTTSKIQYSKTAGSTEGALSYETTFQGYGEDTPANNKSIGKRCYDFY
jgi:type IX secretion system PorP/SprF family membrane protein